MKKITAPPEELNEINATIMAGMSELYGTKGTCYSDVKTDNEGNSFIVFNTADTRNPLQFLTDEHASLLEDYTPPVPTEEI